MIQRLKKQVKEQKGFTLVELLAVIVILGIIAAIAVPAIGNIINDSKEDAAISDALNIINAARIAQAAGDLNADDAPWNYDDLGNYISKAADQDFELSFTDGEFVISNHDANQYVTSGTESDLAAAAASN